jgi:hypothetical protein
MNDMLVPTNEMSLAAFAGPAFAITNFTVHPIAAGLLRVSFIETLLDGSNPQYRAAVVLDPEGARNLAELLLRFAPPKAEPSA